MQPQEIAKIETHWTDLNEKIVDLCSQIDPNLAADIKETQAKFARERQVRDEAIKKAHPDGKHWPINEECPICQRILGDIVEKAKACCVDPNNEDELIEKMGEVIDKRYGPRKNESNDTQS
jgi:hypothetical protein